MDKILKLQQARGAALARAEAMVDKDGKWLAGADQKGWDTAMADVERLDGEIKAAQEAADAEAAAAADAETAAAARVTRVAAARRSTGPRTQGNQEGRETPTGAAGRAVITGVRARVLDDPRRGFASMGDFAQRILHVATPGHHLQSESLGILAAATGMSQTVGADGGFLVPPEFASTIWDGLNRSPDSLLGRTDQYTVEGESLTMNANAETSRATGSRYGGIQGYWLSEAGQITKSKPTFRQMKLEPSQLAVLCYATDKLLANPIALDQWITRAAMAEIDFLTGDAIINGTGAGQPKGIISSGGRVHIAKESGQAATTIVLANINKMYSAMHMRSLSNAVWFINQECLPQLEALSLAIGVGGVPVYLPPGGVTEAPNARLKGRPVVFLEYCAGLGTEGDIIFADMSAYASGVKGGVQSAMSMHLRFDYAETAFRFMFAVDGQPWVASPITPYKGSQKTSPFVTLDARP